MSARTEAIEAGAEKLLLPILEENGFELVDVEYVKEAGTWYLRAYCDKEGGFTVNDCELTSRAWEAKLDEADLIEEAYVLEVSSPGLGRPLKKPRDFERALGKEIEIRTYKAYGGEKEFTGVLRSWSETDVTIGFEDGSALTFDRKDIAVIRMAFDF